MLMSLLKYCRHLWKAAKLSTRMVSCGRTSENKSETMSTRSWAGSRQWTAAGGGGAFGGDVDH